MDRAPPVMPSGSVPPLLCPPNLTPIPNRSPSLAVSRSGMPDLLPYPGADLHSFLPASDPLENGAPQSQQHSRNSAEEPGHSSTVKQRRLQNGIPFTIIRLPPPPPSSVPVIGGRVEQRPRVPATKLRMIRPMIPSLPPLTATPQQLPASSTPRHYHGQPPSGLLLGDPPRPTPGCPPTCAEAKKITLEDYLALPNGPTTSANSEEPLESDVTATTTACLSELWTAEQHSESMWKPEESISEFPEMEEVCVDHSTSELDQSKKAKKKRKKKLMKNQIRNLQEACSDTVFAGDECRMRRDLRDESPCWERVVNDKVITEMEIPSSLEHVLNWEVQDVAEFVSNFPHSSEEVVQKFRENLIDGEALVLLTQDDFINHLNLKLGLALKIYHSVLSVKHLKEMRPIEM